MKFVYTALLLNYFFSPFDLVVDVATDIRALLSSPELDDIKCDF